MVLSKNTRKFLTRFIPKGNVKEDLKSLYYNLVSDKKIAFKRKDNLFQSQFEQVKLTTNEALYNIVPDFDYYQHFYKVKDGDYVIDAGANFGHLTMYFSFLAGTNGKVFAFEPDEQNKKYIDSNLLLNPNLPQNIIHYSELLWKKNEWVEFCEAGTVASSAKYFDQNSVRVKKESISLDSWIKNNSIQHLDFIKMDIEGAEIEAMEGSIEMLKSLNPNLAIASYHIINGEPTYIWLEKFFTELNYPFKTITFRKNEIITFAGPSILHD